MSDSSWLTEIPQLDRAQLLEIRKTLDGAYRSFSREYGDTIEGFFDPLLSFLVWFENLLLDSPWWLVIAVLASLAYVASRSWKLTLGVIVSFVLIGVFGMWDNTMRTMSIILVSTLVAIGVGIPIGIAMARSDRVQNGVTPMLDVMQTMPAFVYLIPVVMLLGIGKIPGVIAVVIYAIPPVIRLTNLGIRLVDKEVLEAATAYGASPMQRLFGVQLPLAMPNIMAGINQTIMMALAMVVIASMIGVKGLGQPVLKSITNQYFTLGLLNGLAIVALAIIFDRISQSYAKRTQQHLGGSH
ncbi:proline/glycine betaine ABC transporter permease [Photobacterium damselae subsp. damselae]|uniref:Proline/glycine betaine ABC transporter permease n=1 Tax=Photobacterium damselae subsp. damselae TaxID=85581 RepID=A0AAD3WWW8_PHODD|nr:proline/glycine betaine ABC transporter permease [Photobacterium damselae]KAB1182384.1 proline/glycine betaine ABC transporter permease [Photobacterium damselae subsp. damselae]MCG3815932.1 proline/glycine betaine ABC transporter permease [Photobacterium damselae]MDC4170538.1 proline/glycine betaine ABC transporter permease [Photobacterium damselae]PSB78589.1 ABC transporter permease [Photobacterium damselae subsp. damselae]TGZ35203.1 Glycine betaine/choline transport system permease protei